MTGAGLPSIRSILVLALVAGIFCTPLFLHLGLGDQETDEAIYSYAVQSILETGDWMNPQPGHEVWKVMLGTHVLQRMSVALESNHVKP